MQSPSKDEADLRSKSEDQSSEQQQPGSNLPEGSVGGDQQQARTDRATHQAHNKP
jgi:hypothetical protein